MPRWLALLLAGIVIGAGGVMYVQERHMPPRLSADESARLRQAAEQAEAERLRLQSELGDAVSRLEAALTDKNGFSDELAASRATIGRLRQDIASVVASLPPDPRGGAVQVRAARFAASGATLAYDVVLSREATNGKPMTGVMQLVVAGESGRGADSSVTLGPVALSVGAYESLRGSLPLPDGFKPRQATVRVLDRVDGKLLGMRVLYVQ